MSAGDISTTCPECGAPLKDGLTCQEQYEALLAWEYEYPAAYGAAHHITVTCYNLQHPAKFTPRALESMRSGLREIVEKHLPPQELRRRNATLFAGKEKVLRHLPGAPVLRRWSRTVADIRTDSPEVYIMDINAWARAILAEIEVV